MSSLRSRRPAALLAVRAALLLALPLGLARAQRASDAPASGLRAGVDTIAVTVELPDRVIPVATAFQTLQRVRHAGHDAWEQTYQWLGNDGSHTADTLWFSAGTLLPLENHRYNAAFQAATTFRRSGAHTRHTPSAGETVERDTAVAGPLYASGELEALIRTAPLAAGFTAGPYLLYYGPPGALVREAGFRVTGSETVKDRHGAAVECWVVEAPLSEGLNVFYVSKGDRRVVRLVNHEDPRAAFVFAH